MTLNIVIVLILSSLFCSFSNSAVSVNNKDRCKVKPCSVGFVHRKSEIKENQSKPIQLIGRIPALLPARRRFIPGQEQFFRNAFWSPVYWAIDEGEVSVGTPEIVD